MKKLFLILLIIFLLSTTSCNSFKTNQITETTEQATIITENGWSAPDYQNIQSAQYDVSKFTKKTDNKIIYEDENYYSESGIDVSAFQGNIDWQKVASDGVDFAILRIGFRGYGPSGLIYEDENFEINYEAAINAGLKVGVYFFSQCITVKEAKEEAEFICNIISDKKISYPIVFDWEHVDDNSARTTDINSESVTSFAKIFCDTIKEYGYSPAIYFNCSDGYNLINLDELAEYNFWLAEYNETPSFYYHYSMWQYSDKGTIDGISGNVDLNISLISKENTD